MKNPVREYLEKVISDVGGALRPPVEQTISERS